MIRAYKNKDFIFADIWISTSQWFYLPWTEISFALTLEKTCLFSIVFDKLGVELEGNKFLSLVLLLVGKLIVVAEDVEAFSSNTLR